LSQTEKGGVAKAVDWFLGLFGFGTAEKATTDRRDALKDMARDDYDDSETSAKARENAIAASPSAQGAALNQAGLSAASHALEATYTLGIGAIGARAGKAIYQTTKEASAAAEALGYAKINQKIHGEAIFTNGKRFITRDATGHNGGAWKMADSIKALGSRETRMGTFDALLRRIGD